MTWETTARAKRESVLEAIPGIWRLAESDLLRILRLRNVTTFVHHSLTPLELQITCAAPTIILERIRNLTWSALEVTRAFCHRASIAHQLTSCLSEVCFEAAESRAKELDHVLRSTGKTVGPFHGLPVSLKDDYNVAGLDSACGFVSWLGHKKTAEDEGIIVTKLREAGAIIFVKTNVPMSLLIGETTNNIIGSTINPYNRNLTAGGASGGEGALIALKGSPLGWGSDISGSIRIPCAFNNLFGLRPSVGRTPATGMITSLPGIPTAMTVSGPMAADIQSLVMMMKWITGLQCYQDDHRVIDMPWDEAKWADAQSQTCKPGQRDGKFVFGIMKSDKDITPHPPVQRAMNAVEAALRQRGYELVEWTPPAHLDAAHVFMQILGSTAGQEIRDAVRASGEPPIPQIRDLFPNGDLESSTTAEFWKLCLSREDYRQRYHSYWRSTRQQTSNMRPVDGVILPVAPHGGMYTVQIGREATRRHANIMKAPPETFFKCYAFTAVPSLLDFTTGAVPVTFSDSKIDHEVIRHEFRSDTDRQNWQLYHADMFSGSPIGVQVMGQRLQEEKVLAMMEAVSAALQEMRST